MLYKRDEEQIPRISVIVAETFDRTQPILWLKKNATQIKCGGDACQRNKNQT